MRLQVGEQQKVYNKTIFIKKEYWAILGFFRMRFQLFYFTLSTKLYNQFSLFNLLIQQLVLQLFKQVLIHLQHNNKQPLKTISTISNQMNVTLQKCKVCKQPTKQSQLKALNCQKHFLCFECLPKNTQPYCDRCQIIISESSSQTQRELRNYPIQGILVHHDKLYNPDGESEFSSRRNCHQRTNGWILCNFLAVVFFFSGLAVAIKTSQLGTGIIMAIVGAIGIVASIFFICKVRKVDKYYESGAHLNQDKFIYVRQDRNQQRSTISSVKSERHSERN